LQELLIAPYEVLDPGTGQAIVVNRWNQHIGLTIAASTAETNTLAAPTQAGQRLSIIAMSVGGAGSRVVTVASAIDSSGHTTMTFDAVDEAVTLEAFPVGSDTYEWRVVFSSGMTAG